jgi:nitrogen fixation protein FixH
MRQRSFSLQQWFAQDRWIPWTFVAGFVVVVAVNAVMVQIALSSFSGLATRSPYERGVAYNRVLDEAQRQAALGWQVDVSFASAGRESRAGRLEIIARDTAGAALDAARVQAILTRPVERIEAVELTAPSVGAGRFEAFLNVPLAGQWDLQLIIHRGDQRMDLRRRLFVP